MAQPEPRSTALAPGSPALEAFISPITTGSSSRRADSTPDGLSSEDGIHWRDEPGRSPASYVAGYFLGDPAAGVLTAWTSDAEVQRLRVVRPTPASQTAAGRRDTSIGVLARDQPLPDSVNVEFEDGLSCETASCVLIGDRLLLIPPPGTPPLPDRVPRTSEGTPLLAGMVQLRCSNGSCQPRSCD